MFENRTGKTLAEQASNFLINLGKAQALEYILYRDSEFSEFLKEECRLDVDLVMKISQMAGIAANGLVREEGIVTEENCTRWLDKRRNPV